MWCGKSRATWKMDGRTPLFHKKKGTNVFSTMDTKERTLQQYARNTKWKCLLKT